MKKTIRKTKPARRKLTVLRQLCNLIPEGLAGRLARETGADKQARTFSVWSHVVAQIYAQLTHAVSLQDACDALQMHSGPLSAVRGAVPPSKNTFSHANRKRPAALAEKLFWQTYEHLASISPKFAGRGGSRLAWRFRRPIQIVDATVFQLVANCMDWAKHRRRKAAAKCHLRLDLQSFLPRFAIVDVAREGDISRAEELCAGLQPGEIVVMDRGYVDFRHLNALDQRGVFWVVRAKSNLSCRAVRQLSAPAGRILSDEEIELTDPNTVKHAPKRLRKVIARVEVDGKEEEMVFLSNNLDWAPSSVSDLYRCRWQIEVFFKQLKQNLQVADFLGYNANAVRWQVWSALLTYLLLRYAAFLSQWDHAFSRLRAVIRSGLWQKLDLTALLQSYGTADGHFRFIARPEQAYFPSFG